jgi:hypothetical protein
MTYTDLNKLFDLKIFFSQSNLSCHEIKFSCTIFVLVLKKPKQPIRTLYLKNQVFWLDDLGVEVSALLTNGPAVGSCPGSPCYSIYVVYSMFLMLKQ